MSDEVSARRQTYKELQIQNDFLIEELIQQEKLQERWRAVAEAHEHRLRDIFHEQQNGRNPKLCHTCKCWALLDNINGEWVLRDE